MNHSAKDYLEVFRTWSTYETVLEKNYMFHNEIYEDVKRLLSVRSEQNRLTLLDLGSGSAHHLARALQGCEVARYRGYDISDAAITRARQNLAYLPCPIELYQSDLLEGLKAETQRYDVIFSSFALHHLAFDEKAVFFELASHALDKRGMVLLVDIAREEDEDRQIWLERYCAWVRTAWKALSPEELEVACDHIQACDFPETTSGLYTLAACAGFSRCREVNRFRWSHTWCFEKSL